MLWLLKILAFGHVHKWKEVSRAPLEIHHEPSNFVSKGVRVITTCEKCGAWKKWDLE